MQAGQSTALLTSDLQREQELPRIATSATVLLLLLHIQFFMPNAAVVLQQHAAQTHTHTHSYLHLWYIMCLACAYSR